MASRSIVVLGGGISGLSAAFYLTRRFPADSGTRIILVESSDRLGGWVKSEKERVKDDAGQEAEILLESGPRTLRPVAKGVLELVNLLDLKSAVVTVSRSAPPSRNRFLHLPGTEGLTAIPGSLVSLFRSPLTRILLPPLLKNAWRSTGIVLNNSSPNDESLDAFLTRHFGEEFARTFGSALIHGIYATDSRLLSVQFAFPTMCRLEERGKGSVVRGAINGIFSASRKDGDVPADEPHELGDITELMKGISVFSFQDGLQTLTDTLASRLEELAHVEIVKGDGVVALGKSADGESFEMTTASGKRLTPSHMVSAIPLPRLHELLSASSADKPLPHLTANPSASVTVVNLVFPPTSEPINPDGFGYLVPRPSTDYPTSSLGILGTVFDSCALPTQDKLLSSPSDESSPRSPFTKLTVMLGGAYGTLNPAPSDPTFVPTLVETLRVHLGRADLPEPCLVRVREHQDCIPTPTVGHATRMAELKAAVKERWGTKAAVIGAAVGGVGVGDCVEGGRRAAYSLEL